MKNIKRIWLALCMSLCLFALTACSGSGDADVTIEEEAVSNMQMLAENYITAFSEMTDEELATQLAAATKSKDYTMQTAFKSWESVKGDLGALVSYETATVSLGDEGYMLRFLLILNICNNLITISEIPFINIGIRDMCENYFNCLSRLHFATIYKSIK